MASSDCKFLNFNSTYRTKKAADNFCLAVVPTA
jgi:hypothetical protein